MDAPREYSSDDITRLGTGLNDLGSILALPAVWAGAEPSQIVSTLVDTLLEILHLSFVFVRLSALDGTPSIEIMRIADSLAGTDRAREIRDAIDASLGDASPKPLSRSTTPVGEVDLSVASARLGLDGEIGIIVAGSHRPDFPAQTERLFLDIAANQATIGLQQAYLAEQRRVAEVLHERVAQHTRELAIANEALRESEHTSRLLVHTIPGLVAILTPAGEVDVVNHELVEYCGQPLEAMKQWGTNGTIHPDDLPRVVQVFTQAISSGDSYDFEARIRRFDGVYHWCQVRGLPFRDPSGRILRWYVLLSDIDDRKRAENALRESERESRLIVDSIPGFIAAFTPDGELEFVNRPIFEYFGKTLGELKHWGSGGMVHPEDLPRVVEVFTQSIASGDTFEIELRGRRFDGVYRWFQSRGLPLRDTSEHIVRWYNLLIDIDDRKRAEEALRESERKFRLLVETIPAFVWRGTSEGELDYLNERAVEYLGRTAQSLAGGGWIELVHPDHRDATVRRWLHSSTTGSSYDDIYKIRRADGQYRWIQSIGEPFYDAEGQIAHWYGVIIDIDDRKRAEQELRLSEARKAAILDSAIDCIVTIDHEGCITEFNPAAERTFGYRRDEVVGQQLADIIIPPALRERHRQGFARYLATGEARVLGRRIEMTAVRADGSEFPTELAITRIPSDGPPSFTGYLRDITERKQSEEELRRSAAFLAEAQQLSRVGSFSWEVATDDIMWSEQLYRIFEIDRGVPVTFEVIGTRVHPEDLSTFKEQIERSRQDGSEVQLEIRLQMPDRTIKYVHVVAHCRSHGNQLEYIGAVQDVTQRRLSEEALAKVRSELAHVARATSLGVLTASIAHEVNQPLAGIITNAGTCLRMLGADPPDVDGARETARRTIRDGNRASDVMTRLRALFSKREFSLESVDLNEATQEVIALSLSDLQRHRVILQSELADDLPTVTGDRIQLQQVILNLVRNASEAMVEVHKRPRLLLIKTEREDVNRVRLTVRDSGIGLPPESLDSLFDAFHTTKSGGMGIGLFVSRSIVERHQGRLWAEPNDGRPGATFSFSIPFQRG